MKSININDFIPKENGELGAFACASDSVNQWGLTKREYFAGLAMQGLISNLHQCQANSWDTLAVISISYADALLEKLNEK